MSLWGKPWLTLRSSCLHIQHLSVQTRPTDCGLTSFLGFGQRVQTIQLGSQLWWVNRTRSESDFRVNWVELLAGLLARLAEHNAGEIDWSSCLPVIFTRVLKMFSLPVYYSKINVGHKGVSLDSSTAAKWIIYTLGSFPSVHLYLLTWKLKFLMV